MQEDLCLPISPSSAHPESWQIVGKWFLSEKPANRKSENNRINTGNLWWAWVDLNHRPRPYQY
jgi:hypothetical protein